MLAVQSEAASQKPGGTKDKSQDLEEEDSVQDSDELDYWEKLVFSFDMDREPSGGPPRGYSGGKEVPKGQGEGQGSSGHSPQSHAPQGAAAHPTQGFQGQLHTLDLYTLAQLAAAMQAAGIQQGGGVQQPDPFAELRRIQAAAFAAGAAYPGIPSQYMQPPPPPPPPPPPHGHPAMTGAGLTGMPIPGYYPHIGGHITTATEIGLHPGAFSYPPSGYPVQGGMPPGFIPPGFGVPGPSGLGGTPSHNFPSPAAENEDIDDAAMTEDKRRRNTAASARFRIKKKHKTLELERSVADLEGRADDLEREAAELRRENGWLKEMLIMKGRRGLGAFSDNKQDESKEDDEDEEEDAAGPSAKNSTKGKEKARED